MPELRISRLERDVSIALLVLCSVACGSTTHSAPQETGDAGGAGGSGGATILDQTQAFAEAASTAACRVLFSCACNLVATSMCTFGQCPTTQTECEAAIQGRFFPSGNSIFHADQAQACLDALAGDGCEIPPACMHVYEPSGEPGSSCTSDSECIGAPGETAYCAFRTTSCVAYTHGASGAPCDTTCAGSMSPLFCNSEAKTQGVGCWEEDGLRCLDGVCAPLGTTGDVCTSADALTGCDPNNLCSGGQCALNGVPLGASCSSTTEACSGHAYCAADGTCQPTQAGGAACTLPSECASGVCHAGQCTGALPNATGVCTWF